MFIDQAWIQVHAGSGGRGSVSFRREKHVPMGGPDGGDGGKGGDVYLRATARKNTLLDFQYRRQFSSRNGQHGSGGNCTGKSSEDVWIEVPVGTVVREQEDGTLLADLDRDGSTVLVARGGRGGKGNARFVTATEQAPTHAQPGEPGEERRLALELKLLADVGLIGMPNAGKSTLLSKISAARPKIAAYPFTTLEPLLGTVRLDDNTVIVAADIPGLIEGAAEGHGLGLQFLRHVERTRLLLHLVDLSGEQELGPVERYKTIVKELRQYSKTLGMKPKMIVGTKMDSVEPDRLKELKAFAKRNKIPFAAISAVTGEGVPQLLHAVREMFLSTKKDEAKI